MTTTSVVRFNNSQGQELVGRLDEPDSAAKSFALFAHCFTCGKDLTTSRTIARSLAATGVGVLRFDFTGLGESDGEFGDTSFSSNVSDLLSAIDWLSANRAAPQLLVGHSLGGTATLAVAERAPSVRAVATIGSPSAASHVKELFAANLVSKEPDGSLKVSLAGRPFVIGSEMLTDLDRQNLDNLGAAKFALLVAHSPQDNTVSVDHATAIFAAARHPKSFLSLDGADHLLTNPADAEYLASVIAAWASRYLD